jgi:hypothetical protein
MRISRRDKAKSKAEAEPELPPVKEGPLDIALEETFPASDPPAKY